MACRFTRFQFPDRQPCAALCRRVRSSFVSFASAWTRKLIHSADLPSHTKSRISCDWE